MHFKRFGSAMIVRATLAEEAELRQGAKRHLLSKFAPGTYAGAEVNFIAQHQYQFFESKLNSIIPLFASRDAAEFLLSQYDEASKVFHGTDLESETEKEEWMSIEGSFKRAIKYIVELMCIKQHLGSPVAEKERLSLLMGTAISCAEQMADLAEMSGRVFSIFPNDCLAVVHDRESPPDYELSVTGKYSDYDTTFYNRVTRDRGARDRFAGKITYDINVKEHEMHLGQAFFSSFGANYSNHIAIIGEVINCSRPAPNTFPTLFVKRDELIRKFSEASGFSENCISNALSAFTLTPEKLLEEQRVLWNPKQEYRALCRGFFSFPHESGTHLAFSSSMVKENVILLMSAVAYQWLPAEWRNQTTNRALKKVSLEAGKWFERLVIKNLNSIGIVGQRAKNYVGEKSLRIPDLVGEIDFLGYNAKQNAIVIIESKMISTGLEARFWRDDLYKFVTGKRPYAEQLRRKVSWVELEQKQIRKALNLPSGENIQMAMLTLYPCIADLFIKDFRCVSLTEFMLDWQTQGNWPY